MKLYLAAPYSWKDRIREYRAQLREIGVEVTSNWLDEPHAANVTLAEVQNSQLRHYAEMDLVDIERADGILFFSVDPSILMARGGRHVEFGYAMGIGRKLFVVGPKENIFHYQPNVILFETWEAVLLYFGGKR